MENIVLKLEAERKIPVGIYDEAFAIGKEGVYIVKKASYSGLLDLNSRKDKTFIPTKFHKIERDDNGNYRCYRTRGGKEICEIYNSRFNLIGVRLV